MIITASMLAGTVFIERIFRWERIKEKDCTSTQYLRFTYYHGIRSDHHLYIYTRQSSDSYFYIMLYPRVRD